MRTKCNFYKKSDKEFLQTLTAAKVYKECITRKINHKRNKKTRIWTKQEYDFMVENWGKLSKKEIAETLDRSLSAVICKASKIGLKNYFVYSDEITLNELHRLIFGRNIDTWTFNIWERYKMPFKTLITNKEQDFKVIKISDFLEWFEKYKRVIDLSQSCQGCFGDEPEWLIEKRQADKRAAAYGPHNRVWTIEEDNKLKSMVAAKKYGYRDISIELKRTEGSIKKRLLDLKIIGRPIKADNHNKWKPEEIEIVKDLWLKGYQSCIIAEYTPNRSALAINGLLERYKYFGEPPLKFKM